MKRTREADVAQTGSVPKTPRVQVNIPYVCSPCTSEAITKLLSEAKTEEILMCMFVEYF